MITEKTKTVVSKGHYGWSARTLMCVNGTDYLVTTGKRHNGVLACSCRKEISSGGMVLLFNGDEPVLLAHITAQCNEKNIRELHEKGLAKFREFKTAEAAAPPPYQITIGQVVFTEGPWESKERAVFEILPQERYRTVMLDASDIKIDDFIRNIKDKFGIGNYYREGDIIPVVQVETLVTAATENVRLRNEAQAAQSSREQTERAAKIEAGRKLVTIPADAVSIIIASHRVDESDPYTDYHGHTTDRVIYLAYSTHDRDLFPEFRKAALLCPETEYMATLDKDCEHREKYSMGGGYYLGESRHSGWVISKTSITNQYGISHESLYIAAADGRYFCNKANTPTTPTAPPSIAAKSDMQLIKYSDKAICLIGEHNDLKDILRDLGGSPNRYLKDGNGGRFTGWIFSAKRTDRVKQALNIKNN